VRTPSEVAQFDMPGIQVDHKNVLWLDIPVNNIALLQKPQS